MSETQLLYQIALTLVPGIGDIHGKKLVAYCGGAEAVFMEKKDSLLKIPGVGEVLARSIRKKDILARAEKEIAFIRQYRIAALFFTEPGYPERLRHCEDSPMLIYCKGTTDLNRQRIISIVGTRSPTAYGHEMCQSVIQGIADLDVIVVSGLAYGIDSIAHKTALQAGLQTIGILAHGLDQIYPYLNRSLAEKIVQQGGLVTEFINGTRLNRDYFPRRNRIIAGLADATLVVESAEKGGALITADIANSYNRDVFAIPGRVGDPKSAGCNFLIRTNRAALVQSAADIRFMMGWDEPARAGSIQQKMFIELSEEEQVIMNILQDKKEADIDDIWLTSKMTASKTASILLKLEFEGLIKCLPGKRYQLQ